VPVAPADAAPEPQGGGSLFRVPDAPEKPIAKFAENIMRLPGSFPDAGGVNDPFLRRMAQFFNATTDAIVFLDPEQKITFLNRRARELLSPLGELNGANLFPSMPRSEQPVAENDASEDDSVQTLRGGEFEAFYPAPLDLWLRVQSYPVEDGTMVFFRDITGEKLAQEQLRCKSEEAERQHEELETVYRTAPIGLALFDTKDFRYQRLNDRQAAFFGLKPEEIVGRTVTEMAPIKGLKELFDQVQRGEPVVNYPLEGTLITDPDDYRYWTVSYFPVPGPDGTIRGISAASLEITQQKRAEQALIQSEKLAVVGRLVSSIAHEINNPLEAITNLLYLARISDDVTGIHKLLGAAEQELQRVGAIASQTLRFHKQATEPQAVTTDQLIRSVLMIYQGKISNSDVTANKRIRMQRPIRCFEGEIRQVISNLVSNALDAMDGGSGKLELRSRAGTNWSTGEKGVVITIADTGAGMKPATRRKLFQPFFTTKGVTGTGLGLWVSQQIVARHRGSLQVRSSQSDAHHGTVFTIFLPFDAVIREH
jgi:PAS domain S-box-containing protein